MSEFSSKKTCRGKENRVLKIIAASGTTIDSSTDTTGVKIMADDAQHDGANNERTEALPEVKEDGAASESGEAHNEQSDITETLVAAAESSIEQQVTGDAKQVTKPTYTARVTPLDEEPYDFDKSTLLVTMQLMPDDGHADGREVALTISTHSDIPILKLVRLKQLEPLPPWLQALLDEMQEAMPSYGADAERRKEEEKAIRRAATTKTSSTSAKNLKSSSGKKPGAAATTAAAPKPSDSTTAPVFEDQGSLFNLTTGHRPKSNETAAAGGGQ
jgi:hypothetical protein